MSALQSTARPRPDPVDARPARLTATLALIALGYLLIVLDTTIVNVALPSIQADLGFDPAGLAWVFNAYLIAFGGLLLFGGRAGDILGRRRVFLTGVSMFTISSLIGGLAPTAESLVAMRIVQGAGAALIAPNGMALLAANFEAGPSRNRALSVYATVALTGGSIGLLLGGLLTTFASWRWVMFVVVPIGLAIVVIGPRIMRETERRAGRFDIGGALTSTFGMASVVYGLIQAGATGFTGEVLVELAVGVALLAAFVVIESRAAQPIVPLRLFADRERAGSYINLALLGGAMFGTLFVLTQYLQSITGFDPLSAGLAFLPQTASAVVAVRLGPRLISRFGAQRLMLAGATLAAIGLAGLVRITTDSSYFPEIVLPLMLLGLGVGSSVMPLNATILARIDPGEAGAASGVAQAMQWVGGSLGIAILTSVIGPAARGATTPADAAAAFSQGASSAFAVADAFVIVALLVVAVVLRPRDARPAGSDAPARASEGIAAPAAAVEMG